jgi:hypothetical protein
MEKVYKKITVRFDVSDIPDASLGKLVFFDATVYYGKNKDVIGIESSKVNEVVEFKTADAADSYVMEVTPHIPAFGKISIDKNAVTIEWDFGEERVGGNFRMRDVIDSETEE